MEEHAANMTALYRRLIVRRAVEVPA